MSTKQTIAHNLASAFLAGEWTSESMTKRGAEACGRKYRWLASLVRRVLDWFGEDGSLIMPEVLCKHIQGDRGFSKAYVNACKQQVPLLNRIFWTEAKMSPKPGHPKTWTLPALATTQQFADWLKISRDELDWLADLKGRLRRQHPAQQHYVYQWIPKRQGHRLLEIPKPELKLVQRQILRGILDQIPPHECAHGFRRDHSILSYVQPHARRQMVLHLDLRDFFVSIPSSRAHATFRTAGYPDSVSQVLTAICTNSTPEEVWTSINRSNSHPRAWNERRRFVSPHLPQGSPTSPALANLCAFRFDCRLAGLAKCVEANYTRYADDLVLSGDAKLARGWRSIYHQICVIAREEGFEINTQKTQVLRPGVRQQVAGVVLNEHPNVKRSEFDRLKAILHNCVRHGPESQNRDGHADFQAHLRGRITYVTMLNFARGEKLQRIFEQINWPENQTVSRLKESS